MPSDMENLNRSKKLTMGRRKIEIKKIQKKTSLQVTFTKRRSGLFKKAAELSVLCGSELAILLQSPAKKVYAFGSPSVESVLRRFDMGESSIANNTSLGDDVVKTEYQEAVRILEEKKMEEIIAMNHQIQDNGFWWDQEIEGMKLQELEEYLQSLEDLRKNISCRIEEMEKLPTYNSSPSSVFTVPNQGSMEDTSGGLPVQNNQELEKLVEVNDGDAAAHSDGAQMKKDDGASGYSNLGTNLTYGHDFDDLFFTLNNEESTTSSENLTYGHDLDDLFFTLNNEESTTSSDLEAFLGGSWIYM